MFVSSFTTEISKILSPETGHLLSCTDSLNLNVNSSTLPLHVQLHWKTKHLACFLADLVKNTAHLPFLLQCSVDDIFSVRKLAIAVSIGCMYQLEKEALFKATSSSSVMSNACSTIDKNALPDATYFDEDHGWLCYDDSRKRFFHWSAIVDIPPLLMDPLYWRKLSTQISQESPLRGANAAIERFSPQTARCVYGENMFLILLSVDLSCHCVNCINVHFFLFSCQF